MICCELQDAPVAVHRMMLPRQTIQDQGLVDAIVVHSLEKILARDRPASLPEVVAAYLAVGVEISHQWIPLAVWAHFTMVELYIWQRACSSLLDRVGCEVIRTAQGLL